MYCKKCEIEIQGGTETICPLCNTPLEEFPAAEQGAAPDASSENLKLREMISDIERTITTSLDSNGKRAEPKPEEFSFDLERALSEELPRNPEPAAPPVTTDTAAGDYKKPRAVMDQPLAGIRHAPLPTAEPPRRSAIKSSAAVLLILGVVAAGVAAGYLFSSKEPPAVRTAAPVRRIAPPDAPKAAAVTLPAPQQPREMPVPAESRPTAPSVAPPAAPAQETATAETVQPVKQEQAPSAVEPVKTAAVQIPQTAPAPPSAQPPAAVQKATEPPQQETAEQPKMAKAAEPGFYCVNVGSFKLKASTDRICRDLKKNGYAPAVETVTLNDGNTWYRVTVGSFVTRDEAARFGKELEGKTGIKPVVVKRK